MTAHLTREEWMESAADELRERVFSPAGFTVPPFRVSPGFPAGARGSGKARRIGECFSGAHAEDGIPQVFVAPTVEDSVEVLEILAHEMIHVSGRMNHKRNDFGAIAIGIGFAAPFTSTPVTERLLVELHAIARDLGDYPHAALNLKDRKKQSTRMVKLICDAGHCDAAVRASRKQINTHTFLHTCYGMQRRLVPESAES